MYQNLFIHMVLSLSERFLWGYVFASVNVNDLCVCVCVCVCCWKGTCLLFQNSDAEVGGYKDIHLKTAGKALPLN